MKPQTLEDRWLRVAKLKRSNASLERVFKDLFSYGNAQLLFTYEQNGALYYSAKHNCHLYLTQPYGCPAPKNLGLQSDLAELCKRTGQAYIYAEAEPGRSWYAMDEATGMLIARKGRIPQADLELMVSLLPRKIKV